ncbi:hypothetical protein B0T10DRAFT_142775 [Thelonectria olida]|uniref:Biotrophy-associated secreted protein 2 n=1 Tax=Thelonectria olida TaxID=1576542 RepID=A0A9P9AKF9_9HYPO|nr:hypothetical protein B0T10DRAFT_142775 [Thelonectria olida]
MFRSVLNVALLFALGALALPNPRPLSTDSSGDKNIGNGQGLQFITGACISDADCQSECCATFSGGGICSAQAVANEAGKQGCGFNGSGAEAPNNANTSIEPPAATTTAAATPAETTAAAEAPAAADGINPDAPGSENVGKGTGEQFITGQCFSDADCASTCCAGKEGVSTGACSAVLAANEAGKTGCGFVQA